MIPITRSKRSATRNQTYFRNSLEPPKNVPSVKQRRVSNKECPPNDENVYIVEGDVDDVMEDEHDNCTNGFLYDNDSILSTEILDDNDNDEPKLPPVESINDDDDEDQDDDGKKLPPVASIQNHFPSDDGQYDEFNCNVGDSPSSRCSEDLNLSQTLLLLSQSQSLSQSDVSLSPKIHFLQCVYAQLTAIYQVDATMVLHKFHKLTKDPSKVNVATVVNRLYLARNGLLACAIWKLFYPDSIGANPGKYDASLREKVSLLPHGLEAAKYFLGSYFHLKSHVVEAILDVNIFNFHRTHHPHIRKYGVWNVDRIDDTIVADSFKGWCVPCYQLFMYLFPRHGIIHPSTKQIIQVYDSPKYL